MKGSQVLEKFFEKQHKQWKKECYAVFKPESRPSSLKGQASNRYKDRAPKPILKPR